MGDTDFDTFEFANSIRPFDTHNARRAFLLAEHARLLSTKINVYIVDDQKVFGQHEGGENALCSACTSRRQGTRGAGMAGLPGGAVQWQLM